MFEGFTMPPLTLDSERNAMYKQVQCRPTAILADENVEQDAETLVLEAFKHYSTPKNASLERICRKRLPLPSPDLCLNGRMT